jgi:hypothetical protein
VIARAKQKKIELATCEPCLEAELLRIKGVEVVGKTADFKERFKSKFGDVAHQPRIYEQHFDREVLDSEVCREGSLGRLIQAIEAACVRKLAS